MILKFECDGEILTEISIGTKPPVVMVSIDSANEYDVVESMLTQNGMVKVTELFLEQLTEHADYAELSDCTHAIENWLSERAKDGKE